MLNIAIINRGVAQVWQVKRSVDLFTKFAFMCKDVFQKPFWADHYRSVTRKLDPPYVVLRSSRRKNTDLVLVRVDDAPANYMEELKLIYSW